MFRICLLTAGAVLASPFSPAADGPKPVPADHVKIIKISVQTTNDDKDNDLYWEIEVFEGKTIYGSGTFGKGETWNNNTSTDLDLTMTTPFPVANSKSVKMKITQKSSSKNYGWEGWVSVKGFKGNDGEVKLLDKTKEFKLGENGNPRDVTFTFE